MKRVVIVRHGKAVPYGYEDDFNRDLNKRGENDARLVSEVLNRQGVKPDVIISSPAKRAIKTAQIFAENLGFDQNKIVEHEEIYEGLTTSEFLTFIHELSDDVNCVFFFGHNPGFYYFVANLLKKFYGDMPTTSTVGIDFKVDFWSEVEARTGKQAFHLVPKMFK